MTYEDGFGMFEPILSDLAGIVEDAFAEHYTMHAKEAEVITSRTRASELNDRIVAGLLRTAGVLGETHLIRHRGARIIRLPGKCLIRVKKLDAQGRAAYHHTRSSLSFDNNLLVPDLPVEDRLYFGYVVDPVFHELVDVVIAAPAEGPSEPAKWVIRVYEELASQSQFFRRDAVASLEPQLLPKISRKKAVE